MGNGCVLPFAVAGSVIVFYLRVSEPERGRREFVPDGGIDANVVSVNVGLKEKHNTRSIKKE